jgi:hypothetical protein
MFPSSENQGDAACDVDGLLAGNSQESATSTYVIELY